MSLASLKPLASHLQDKPQLWAPVLEENEGEGFLPPAADWTEADTSPERQSFLAMAVVHALRPDRTTAAAAEFVEKVFADSNAQVHDGEEGQQEEDEPQASGLPWNEALDLEEAVKEGARPEAPVLLCSDAGHDASWKVNCATAVVQMFVVEAACFCPGVFRPCVLGKGRRGIVY